MTPETAIVQLKHRAEIADQKHLRDARELAEIANSIIDYYNRTELLEQENGNLRAIIHLLCEYMSVAPEDINTLLQTNADFARRKMAHWFEDWQQNPRWLVHRIITDWQIRESRIATLKEIDTVLLPIMRRQGSPDMLQQMENLKAGIETDLQE